MFHCLKTLCLYHLYHQKDPLVSKRWWLSRSRHSQTKPKTNQSWRDVSKEKRLRQVYKMLRKKRQLAPPGLPKHGLVQELLWLVRCNDLWHSCRRNIFNIPSIRTSVSTYLHANDREVKFFVLSWNYHSMISWKWDSKPLSPYVPSTWDHIASSVSKIIIYALW